MALGFGFSKKWSEIVGHVVTSPHLKEFSKYSYSFMLKFWFYFIEMALGLEFFQKWVRNRRTVVTSQMWRNFQKYSYSFMLKFWIYGHVVTSPHLRNFFQIFLLHHVEILILFHWNGIGFWIFPKNGQKYVGHVVTSPHLKEFSKYFYSFMLKFWFIFIEMALGFGFSQNGQKKS